MDEKMGKLEALYQINESILSILELDKLLERILNIIDKTFGFDSCAILFCDEKTQELYIRAAVGYKPEVIKNFRTTIGGKGITGYVAKTREHLFIPHIEKNSRYIPGVEGAKSEIAIPLTMDDKLLGVLDIESKREYSFSDDDFGVFCLFASQISTAIHNALIFEEEKKKVSQLLVLNKIHNRVSVNLELDKILEIVAKSIIEFLGFSQILIFLCPEGTHELQLMACAGGEDSDPDVASIKKLHGEILDRCFVRNETVIERKEAHAKASAPADEEIPRSELAIPLRIRKEPVGVVHVSSNRRDDFDENDIRILEAIREQLTHFIKEVAEFSNINKRSKHSEILQKIGQVAIQSFDFRKFVNDIVDVIYRTFGFYQVSVFSFEPVSGELELISKAGALFDSIEVGDKIAQEEGVVGWVVRSGKHYLCNDVSRESRYRHEQMDTKAELALPIKHEDNVLGVLNLESPKLNHFDQSDVEIFSRISDQIAYTIVNAELFRQKSSAHNLLLNLNNLSREINSSFDLNASIGKVIKRLPEIVSCRLCSVFFYHSKQKRLSLIDHNLPDVDESHPLSLDADKNVLMNRVITLNRSIFVKNIEDELNIPNSPKYQTKSFVNILLKHDERTIGVLNLTDKMDQGFFTSQEFFLVDSFSKHLSLAIVNCEKYQKILELSITDGLTGLYVHRFFQDSLAREISRAQRHHTDVSLVMVDIDDFKRFNDTYGHQVGDIVLREIALLIKKEMRKHDLASRYGGEEFGVIMPSTSMAQARIFAERLRSKIAIHTILHSREELHVTASMGVCQYEAGLSKDEVIKQADMALMCAKKRGKNRVAIAAEASAS